MSNWPQRQDLRKQMIGPCSYRSHISHCETTRLNFIEKMRRKHPMRVGYRRNICIRRACFLYNPILRRINPYRSNRLRNGLLFRCKHNNLAEFRNNSSRLGVPYSSNFPPLRLNTHTSGWNTLLGGRPACKRLWRNTHINPSLLLDLYHKINMTSHIVAFFKIPHAQIPYWTAYDF